MCITESARGAVFRCGGCVQVCSAAPHLVHGMQMRRAAAGRAVQHHFRVVSIARAEPDLESGAACAGGALLPLCLHV